MIRIYRVLHWYIGTVYCVLGCRWQSEVQPHETSRHSDENSTNQALHSKTFYYCKSKVPRQLHQEVLHVWKRLSGVLTLLGSLVVRVLLRGAIGLRPSTLNVTPTFWFNVHTVHIRRIRRKNQQYALIVPLLYFYVLAPTCFGVACHHQGALPTLSLYFQVTQVDPISTLMMAGYCRNM
jgi:hypothetical protein